MLIYFGGPKHLLVNINISLTKFLRIFRMLCEIIVLWRDPCSSLGATTLWVLPFSAILFHSSLFIAILIQLWIFISRICCDIVPHPKLSIPILLTEMLVKSSLCGGSEFLLRAVAASTLLGCYAALLPRRAKAASLQVFTILDCAKQLVLEDLHIHEMKCVLLQKFTVYSRLPCMWTCSIQYSDCVLLLTPFGQVGESYHYWPRTCVFAFLNCCGNYFTLRYLR